MDQVVLPAEVVKRVEKLARELEAVKREIKKAVKISKSQAWFWLKTWQKKERAADRDIKQGKTKTFSSVDELLEDLHSQTRL